MIHARIQEFSSGRGVQVHLAYKNAQTKFFLFYFFSQLILQKSSGYFQRKLICQGSSGGGIFSRGGGGGVQLFTGGSNCLFPIETHKRGSDPLWIRACDSAHRGLINLLVFLFFFNITFANSFVTPIHVAYTEQSAYQTCSPISTHGAVSASDCSYIFATSCRRSINSAFPECL